ncbi:hypothetical protein [Roseomonas chloroacetimidivorans]
MATATDTTAGSTRRRETGFAALVMTPDLRVAIERKACGLLDAADF